MKRIAIIGGGAAGVLAAIALLRRLESGDQVTLIGPGAEIGRGLAYGTHDSSHLLNVRAGNLSALSDDPQNFVCWLAERRGQSAASAAPIFASRVEYGVYLQDMLEATVRSSRAELEIVRDVALALKHGADLEVVLETHAPLHADQVVLATGYLPPGDPSQLLPYKDHLRYLSDPWEEGVLGRIERSDSVLLIGTGLTMVDMVLSLSRRGHTGKMIARSRRGLLPQPHRQGRPAEMKFEDLEISHVRNAVIHLMRDAGEEWRASMDGLRPFTEMLWQSLSWTDRRRFIKRLRPFWDVHRHRMPESVAAAIEALRSQGRLDIGSGTLRSVIARVDGFEVSFGGKHAETVSADWILNCTGPALDMQAAKLPLLESAVQLGLAEYDPLGLGLMVDAEGRTEPSGRIWALGPICRGCRWESTAIPEIRAQAARLSDGIFLTPLP